MWIFFLLVHLTGLVGYNLVLRKSLVEKIDKFVLATIMQTGIVIPILFAMFISPPDITNYDLYAVFHIFVISILVVFLHISNVQALRHLEASVYAILYNLRIIFATILGIVFLNEEIIPLQIFGGLLIFIAVITVRQKGKRDLTNRGIEWGLAASLIISVLNLFEKQLINHVGFMAYAVPVMILATIYMWGILYFRGQRIKLSKFKEPQTIRLMVLRAMSAYGFILAFNAGAVLSVSTYISSLSVIIIVLLGVWLLGENDYIKQKLIATALAFLGLTVILIAHLN